MKKPILLIIIGILWGQMLCMAQTKAEYPLKAGAAKIDITPKDQPTAPANGKYDHERAFIRAIVLDNNATRAALITIEGFLDVPSWAESVKQITVELNCPVENIIISTTHSHSTGLPSLPAPTGGQTVQTLSPYVGNIMEVVRQAKAKLQPAVMAFGKGSSYLNVNRNVIERDTRKWTQATNLDGFSDKSVDLIKFETPGGEPIAVYLTYAMHPDSE